MMTFCNEKLFSPTSREKITLFRHAILLPKNALPDTFRSSIDQSNALMLSSVTTSWTEEALLIVICPRSNTEKAKKM